MSATSPASFVKKSVGWSIGFSVLASPNRVIGVTDRKDPEPYKRIGRRLALGTARRALFYDAAVFDWLLEKFSASPRG